MPTSPSQQHQQEAEDEPTRSLSRSRSRQPRPFARGGNGLSLGRSAWSRRGAPRGGSSSGSRTRGAFDRDDHAESANGGNGIRWRSESRTVRGSTDEEYRREFSQSRSRSRPPPASSLGIIQQKPTSTVQTKVGDIEKGHEKRMKLETRILSKLPLSISRFLGYRPADRKLKPLLPVHLLGPILETWLWAWIGAFVSLGCVALIFTRAEPFATHANQAPNPYTAPVIIGSFGASSVILFGAPASPLGQPYAFFGGQFVSALAGVIVTKLFALNSRYDLNATDQSTSIVWVAGACSTACALLFMIITDTVHPPGGATALLAATSPMVERLGWHYLPVVIISSLVMLGWAFIWMNLGSKRYPAQWAPPEGSCTGLDLYRKIKASFEKRHEPESGKGEQQQGENGQQEKQGTTSDETLKNQQGSSSDPKTKQGNEQQQQQQQRREEWLDEEPWRQGQGGGEGNENSEERLSRWARPQTKAQ